MPKMKKLCLIAALLIAPLSMLGQRTIGLDPAELLKPLSDQWPSYSGDNTGKRYSALKQINTTTVKNLSLKWANTGITTACGPMDKAAPPPEDVAGFPGRGRGNAG